MGTQDETFEARTIEGKRTIGANISRLRTEHGMTIGELADRVGTSAKRMERMERGEARVCFSDLVLIAGALGVTVSDVVDGV